MCSVHCSGTKPHLALITYSQHKIMKSSMKFTMCLKFVFRDKEETSTTFEVLYYYAYVKKFPILLLNVWAHPIMRPNTVYSIIFLIVSKCQREREKERRNFQETFITLASCFSGHRKPIALKLKVSISVETHQKVESTTRTFVEKAM